MTLVSSVELIDGEPSASLAWYVGTFSVGCGSRLSPLFGGDIRLGSLGLGKRSLVNLRGWRATIGFVEAYLAPRRTLVFKMGFS